MELRVLWSPTGRRAHDVARFVGVPVVEIDTLEGEQAAYVGNGPDDSVG